MVAFRLNSTRSLQYLLGYDKISTTDTDLPVTRVFSQLNVCTSIHQIWKNGVLVNVFSLQRKRFVCIIPKHCKMIPKSII